MIALVDYELGNLGSVDKALRRVGCDAQMTQDPAVIESAEAIVVPGVGAFGDCMSNIDRLGLREPLVNAVESGKPYLGICLGLQLLFETSEEAPGVKGLGVLKGSVRLFTHDLKIPQIGWNEISINDPRPPHLEGVEQGSHVYFVHSYHVVPDDESIIATTTDYGYEFCSAVSSGALFASQFHPEKSQHTGLHVLDNFRRMVEAGAGS